MKSTKTGLVILSAILCGSLFAQQPPPPGHPPVGPAPGPHPTPGGGGSFGGSVGVPHPVPGAPASGSGSGGVGHRMATVVHRSSDGDPMGMPFEAQTKRTLIVATSKLDETVRQNIQEDMQIMSLVLDKAVERTLDGTKDRHLGIIVKTFPGAHGQNIYMEDYGPLFILNVPIPLTGPKKTDGAEEQPGDSEWEQAKRELSQKRPFGNFEPMKYDSKKVEALKTNLLEALKNATNIRQLKPDQYITLALNGGGDSKTVVTKQFTATPGEPTPDEEALKNKATNILRQMSETKGLGGQPATLTIRVKKSDVDAFAKGKIDLEEFSKKATVSSN